MPSASMNAVPDELLLQIFDDLSFNELRPVLGTSTRWRALAERCPAFWADIQTPRAQPETAARECLVDPPSELACRRMARTNGRRFTLRLYGTGAAILGAAAVNMRHVEHLDVRLTLFDDIHACFLVLRFAAAPLMRTLSIRCSRTHSETVRTLPTALFSGSACPALERVSLSDTHLPGTAPLVCFSAARDVRYRITANFLSPSTPNLILHFPSMRSLSISGRARLRGDSQNVQIQVFRRLKNADFSRLQYIDVCDMCCALALSSWPLAQVPHVRVDKPGRTSFPFLPTRELGPCHLVLELPAGVREDSLLLLGNDDWTFSRGCTVRCGAGNANASYAFGLGERVAESIRTASVPAAHWPLLVPLMNDAANLVAVRIILDRNLFPLRFDDDKRPRLSCSKLHTVILCGTWKSARITYDELAQFAQSDLTDIALPLSLRLENVGLHGKEPVGFTAYFKDIQTQDPISWSYFAVRDMLTKNDHWSNT